MCKIHQSHSKYRFAYIYAAYMRSMFMFLKLLNEVGFSRNIFLQNMNYSLQIYKDEKKKMELASLLSIHWRPVTSFAQL